MTTKTLLATAFALLLAACGATSTHEGRVSIQADVAALAAQAPVVVTVSASPARVSVELAYDAETGRFVGSMALPAGPQTLSAQALSDVNGDGELEVIAMGSADTTVAENQNAAVVLVLLDLTTPPPVPDHRPIITSAGVSNSNPMAGESVYVWVSAVDVDEDPITYLWTVDCNSGEATISDPTAPATTFSVNAAGTCTVRAAVTANGKTVNANFPMQIGASGLADVTITFAAPPVVSQVFITELATGYYCAIDRMGDEATCADPLALGVTTEVTLFLGEGGDGSDASLDACGGVVTPIESGPGFARFAWEAPQASGICMVTGRVTRAGFTDALPVALLIQ